MEGNLTLLDQILIALALAMDCFTVSIASGLILKKIYIKTTVITALMFGNRMVCHKTVQQVY